MSKKKKSNIKCDVESCKHQNTEEGVCELDEIKVSCECNNDDCECNEETICESFDCNKESDPDIDKTTDEDEDDNDTDTEVDIDSDDVEYEVDEDNNEE